MSAPEGLYKISELARRTGVSVGTIHFYIREGLLPRPTLKTSRNMAYYDSSFVERIRLVRRLQEERRLPLSMVRTIVAESDNDGVPSLVELEAKAAAAIAAEADAMVAERDLLARTGLARADLDAMLDLGVVVRARSRPPAFSASDAAIVEIVARARTLGLTMELFPATDLEVYLRSIRALVVEEVSLFARRTRGRTLPLPADRLMESVVNLMGELIRHLRRRLIVDLLSSAQSSPRKRRSAR